MNLQKKVEIQSDKITDYSFYLMAFSLAAGLVFTIIFVVYLLFF